MVTLYDQFGREVAPVKRPERRPLAAAPIYDAWREYVAAGLTPETLSALLREADAGDVRRQCELFEQLEEKDGHILGEKTKRQNIILDVDFEVQPADDDPRSVTVAEFVAEYLDGMTDYEDVLVSLQDAVGKGFAGLEIHWDVSEGGALPSTLDFIEQKRFLFTDDSGMLRQAPRLITDDEPMGIEIPAWKILYHRYGGKSGSAMRSGIYRVCAWMYLFKNYAIKDWAVFCEVFGMPLRLGKYGPGASDADKTALVNAISSLGTDAAGVISQDTEIEFVDKVQKTASADLYKALAEFANRENSKAILGQTLSAEVGDRGSYAASKTHNEVRLDLLKADARAVAATIRSGLIRPIVGFNFGWDMPVPKYVASMPEEHEIQEHHYRFGLVTKNEGRRSIGLPDIQGGDVIATEAGQQEAVETAAKQPAPETDTGPADTFDALADQLDAEADLSALVDPVARLLDKCADLEEFRDRLIEAMEHMDTAKLADAMARGLALADMAGRFDAESDA